MARKINIKGTIVSNDDKLVYDWFGIESTSPNDVEKEIEKANGDKLEVIINSGGGDVFASSEIYTMLKSYKGDIETKIVGVAASGASIIAMAGKKVFMSPTAQMMIHNVSSEAVGDYRVMEHEASLLKDYNSTIANAYMLKTGMSKEELLKMMDKETWLTPQQALEKGFIDEIMFNDGQLKLTASMNHSQLLPKEVINKIRNLLGKKQNNQNKKNPFSSIENRTDIFMQKTKAQLNLLKLKGEIS